MRGCLFLSGNRVGAAEIPVRVHQGAISAHQLPCGVPLPLLHSDMRWDVLPRGEEAYTQVSRGDRREKEKNV